MNYVVRDLDESARKKVVSLLFESFSNDPLYQYFSQSSQKCVKSIRNTFFLGFESFKCRGQLLKGIFRKKKLIAVMFVEKPDVSTEVITHLPLVFRFLWNNPLMYVLRSFYYFIRKIMYRPKQPHFYVAFLAVHPKFRRRGFGRFLLNYLETLSRKDTRSCGVALDTQNPHNVEYYRKLGFRLRKTDRIGFMSVYHMFKRIKAT